MLLSAIWQFLRKIKKKWRKCKFFDVFFLVKRKRKEKRVFLLLFAHLFVPLQ